MHTVWEPLVYRKMHLKDTQKTIKVVASVWCGGRGKVDGQKATSETFYIVRILESFKLNTQVFKKEEDIYLILMGSFPPPFCFI